MASSNDGSNDADVNPPSSPKNVYKDPDDGRQRLLLELEFVQCLANPSYVNYLAQNRYFEDEAFIGYLKYLQYWQRPEYIKFIVYPQCLFFLELLQNANFRTAMAYPANKVAFYLTSLFSFNYGKGKILGVQKGDGINQHITYGVFGLNPDRPKHIINSNLSQLRSEQNDPFARSMVTD